MRVWRADSARSLQAPNKPAVCAAAALARLARAHCGPCPAAALACPTLLLPTGAAVPPRLPEFPGEGQAGGCGARGAWGGVRCSSCTHAMRVGCHNAACARRCNRWACCAPRQSPFPLSLQTAVRLDVRAKSRVPAPALDGCATLHPPPPACCSARLGCSWGLGGWPEPGCQAGAPSPPCRRRRLALLPSPSAPLAFYLAYRCPLLPLLQGSR